MCGIAGFVSLSPVSIKNIRNMTDIIDYRGPDDEGFVIFKNPDSAPLVAGGKSTLANDENNLPYFPVKPINALEDETACVAFGHRRLAIVDVSPYGHQPMCCQKENYWITYNGEIYNYIELRKELEDLGHSFLTHSDTEVILAAYAQWGRDCLHKFNGMWAFALYDRAAKTIFLARDRFGVKPLYYWTDPHGSVYFASEIKQFTILPFWRAVLNHQRAYDFLAWGVSDHSNETMFEGVFHLNPGHFALCNLSNDQTPIIQPQKWYNLPDRKNRESERAGKFLDILRNSVRLRLRADVPVGSCLSGGLDSTSIVCLMQDILGEKDASSLQKTFSACSTVQKVDERKWMDLVLKDTDIDAHFVYPSLDDLFAESRKIVWHQDEPYGSTSIYAQWNVFRLAAQNGVRVMLDGQGADEQLAGYHNFFGPHMAGLLKKGKIVTAFHEAFKIHEIYGYSYFNIAARASASILPARVKDFLRKISGKDSLVPPWLDFSVLKASPSDPHSGTVGGINDLSRAQILSTNLPMLLHWEDRDSMAHSIEARVPFLDYRLVEFSASLPESDKISKGVTKRILRDAMSGIMPDAIRDRMDKIGFATPEEAWMRGDGKALFRQELENAIANSGGILKSSALDYFEDVMAGNKPFSFAIWRMISFGQWVRIFNVDTQISGRA